MTARACTLAALVTAIFAGAAVPSAADPVATHLAQAATMAVNIPGRAPHAANLVHSVTAEKKPPAKKKTKKKKWPGWVPGTGLTPKLTAERQAILKRDPQSLAKIGQHIIIGFHGIADVIELLEAKAISGIFITDHNMENRTVEDMRGDIDRFQAIRKAQGLPPLIVAADQEGGVVSRLSPPLSKKPSLSEVIAGITDVNARRWKARAYGEAQGAELAKIGVNLNFAPVVDLNLRPDMTSDGETRLRLRAISNDPDIVADVAGAYCAGLAVHGVKCTLKHFPGLGRVDVDTHRVAASIDADPAELEKTDWIPFRRLMDEAHTITMVGHVRLDKVDDKALSSYSEKVLNGLIRERWKHQGVLVTDDFSMGAITKAPEKIGGAGVAAMRAGMDIILVSYNEIHLNPLLDALLDADSKGAFDGATSKASVDRLKRFFDAGNPLAPRASANNPPAKAH